MKNNLLTLAGALDMEGKVENRFFRLDFFRPGGPRGMEGSVFLNKFWRFICCPSKFFDCVLVWISLWLCTGAYFSLYCCFWFCWWYFPWYFPFCLFCAGAQLLYCWFLGILKFGLKLPSFFKISYLLMSSKSTSSRYSSSWMISSALSYSNWRPEIECNW